MMVRDIPGSVYRAFNDIFKKIVTLPSNKAEVLNRSPETRLAKAGLASQVVSSAALPSSRRASLWAKPRTSSVGKD